MAEVNKSYELTYSDTVGLLSKLVSQYLRGSGLSSRFSALDKDAVRHGNGFEVDLVLAAKKQNDGSTKADEHGSYKPKVMAMTFNKTIGGQYAVTLDERRVLECVGDDAKLQEYAAELTESLYQGWYDDKNAGVASAAAEIIEKAELSQVEISLGEDVAAFAQAVLMNVKAKVEDLREGITGTSFGNTFVGDQRVAARDIFLVMSNAMAATLDVYGYAKVFDAEYLQARNVTRITSNRIPENTVLITDTDNIQVRQKYEKFVDIENSDGTMNFFYNKYEYVEPAIDATGSYVGFPFVVVKSKEV